MSLKQWNHSPVPKRAHKSKSCLFVLERATGIHNISVRRESEPTYLHVFRGVSVSASIF